MTNIEKVAVDSVLSLFIANNKEKLESLEVVKENFKFAKSALGNAIGELTDNLKSDLSDIIDELSPEAIEHIETTLSKSLGVPTKIK